MANDVIRARNQLGGLYTFGRIPDPEIEAAARRNLTLAKLERAVRDAVAAAPPLTTEQREHIVAMLMTGAR